MSKTKQYVIYKREYNCWDETWGFVDHVKIDYALRQFTPEQPRNHNLVTQEPVSYREGLALIKLLPKQRNP